MGAGEILLNGQPIYLRCFGDDQLYLETLSPPTDPNWYLPRLKRARQYGLNAAKSCEEIFSEDYLEAADEAGLMIIQEMPFGLSGYVRTTQHKLEEPWRQLYAREFVGLCKESRNHASVIAYSMCSEVPLDTGTPEAFNFFVRELPARSKELAPHALVMGVANHRSLSWAIAQLLHQGREKIGLEPESDIAVGGTEPDRRSLP